MSHLTDPATPDWSGFTLEAKKLSDKRDSLLNLCKYSEALKAQYELEDIELSLAVWILRKIDKEGKNPTQSNSNAI